MGTPYPRQEGIRVGLKSRRGRERRLVVRVNSDVTMSRGKYAAQAIHAALLLLDAHPGCPVIVLGERRSKIGRCEVVVHDAGWTELAPGTLTAGASWE